MSQSPLFRSTRLSLRITPCRYLSASLFPLLTVAHQLCPPALSTAQWLCSTRYPPSASFPSAVYVRLSRLVMLMCTTHLVRGHISLTLSRTRTSLKRSTPLSWFSVLSPASTGGLCRILHLVWCSLVWKTHSALVVQCGVVPPCERLTRHSRGSARCGATV